MKLAFCVEDESDAEVFRALLSNLLRTEVEADERDYVFANRGWHEALMTAKAVARRAYHGGLDGALFAIDNDGHPQHVSSHQREPTCRLCTLQERAEIGEVMRWSRAGLQPLRYFFAVPVQTVETWLLLHRGHGLKGDIERIGADATGRRALKRELYGVELPTRAQIVEVAVPLARELKSEGLAKVSASFRQFFEQVVA